MGISIKPDINVTYTMKSGYFQSGVSRIYAVIEIAHKNAVSQLKQQIKDPYREWALKETKKRLSEERKRKIKENKEKMKALQLKTGKTEAQIMEEWAKKQGYSLGTALKVFGGKSNVIDIIVNGYSY